MTRKPYGPAPTLVRALARVAKRHPLERKLVVATTLAAGRELLRRLSLEGAGWIGFELTTPRPLALRLARAELEAAGLAPLDAFDAQAMLDEAMDFALAPEGDGLGLMSDGVGFRERAHGAVEALRLAGVGSGDVARVRLPVWEKRRFLQRMLERYEQLLRERRRVDTAAVVGLALEALEAEGARLPPSLGADVVLLIPGLGTRGLTGRLISALSARGAKVLETEPVLGLDVPSRILWRPSKSPGPHSHLHAPSEAPTDPEPMGADFFRAASITDELREVLRRVVERKLGWDQVEIVTTDAAAYGSALHALASRLGVPVTYAVGLPLERTRTGRVTRAYLSWIEEGFQADVIRRLLEAGDLRPPESRSQHAASALARRFRSLRIGWGRKRYRTQIRDGLAAVDRVTQRRGEPDEAFRRRLARRRSELEALRSILFPALRETPAVPDRMGEGGGRVSPAEIARGLRAFLRRVPGDIGSDVSAREEVERVLERVEATLNRRTDFTAALTILRRHLDVRIRATPSWGSGDERSAPWSSEGGHLHLSDLEHGGFAGREAVFIVGLDADRIPGFQGQDAVLLDSERRILSEELPTSIEVLREKLFRFAALLGRVRGSLTMSYCAWDATEARTLGPSPLLLQALRMSRRNAQLTFRDLDAALGRAACPVPAAGPALDSDDAWMAELGRGAVMRAGVDAVAAAFPHLRRGLEARRALRTGIPGPMHGVVEARPDALDPRRNRSLVVSASRLEDLGTCPLRYLQRSVLRIHPPDDPELDPERWLDALRRGSLLHRVYERTLRAAREGGIDASEDAFEALALEALEAGITWMRAEMPVPGEGGLHRESIALRSDVRAFVRMVRDRGAPWVALELTFGLGDDEPVVLEVAGSHLSLRGAIDRVDEDLEGLHVVDYKTGVVRDFAGTSSFHGGRRLQHALYAAATEARLGGAVVSGEYHFPTMRGQNRTLTFARDSLSGATQLLAIMLDGVASGSFVPTDRADDCRFCDFAEICRVRETGFGRVVSPLAEWSEEHLNLAVWPAFASLKQARTFES